MRRGVPRVWQDITRNAKERNLSHTQQEQAQERRRRASDAINLRIAQTYTLTLLPDQPSGARPPTISEIDTSSSSPRGLWSGSVRNLSGSASWPQASRRGSITLALTTKVPGLWEEHGHIWVGQLWTLYTKYCYMPRLRNRQVLAHGIEDGLHWSKLAARRIRTRGERDRRHLRRTRPPRRRSLSPPSPMKPSSSSPIGGTTQRAQEDAAAGDESEETTETEEERAGSGGGESTTGTESTIEKTLKAALSTHFFGVFRSRVTSTARRSRTCNLRSSRTSPTPTTNWKSPSRSGPVASRASPPTRSRPSRRMPRSSSLNEADFEN